MTGLAARSLLRAGVGLLLLGLSGRQLARAGRRRGSPVASRSTEAASAWRVRRAGRGRRACWAGSLSGRWRAFRSWRWPRRSPAGTRRSRGRGGGASARLRERERAWPAALAQLADALEAGIAFPAAVDARRRRGAGAASPRVRGVPRTAALGRAGGGAGRARASGGADGRHGRAAAARRVAGAAGRPAGAGAARAVGRARRAVRGAREGAHARLEPAGRGGDPGGEPGRAAAAASGRRRPPTWTRTGRRRERRWRRSAAR